MYNIWTLDTHSKAIIINDIIYSCLYSSAMPTGLLWNRSIVMTYKHICVIVSCGLLSYVRSSMSFKVTHYLLRYNIQDSLMWVDRLFVILLSQKIMLILICCSAFVFWTCAEDMWFLQWLQMRDPLYQSVLTVAGCIDLLVFGFFLLCHDFTACRESPN